jgi:hypothetical protein
MTEPSREPDPDFWPHVLTRLVRHEDLDADEAAEGMRPSPAGR